MRFSVFVIVIIESIIPVVIVKVNFSWQIIKTNPITKHKYVFVYLATFDNKSVLILRKLQI